MAKYHVNPETGNLNVCRAKLSCPYGGDEKHFEGNKQEAFMWAEKQNQKVAESVDPFIEKALDFEIGDYRFETENNNTSLNSRVFEEFDRLCIENEVTIKSQVLANNIASWRSKNGNVLERYYSKYVNMLGKSESQNTGFIENFVGKDVESAIKNERKNLNSIEDLSDRKDEALLRAKELNARYKLNTELAAELILSKNAVSVPDSISLFEDKSGNFVVKLGEAKLTGENDSKSVPKNIDELNRNQMFDSEHVKVEKAIMLTTTHDAGEEVDDTARFKMAARWRNSIEKQELDLGVVCNEKCIEFASGGEMDGEHYQDVFLSRLAEKIAQKMFDNYYRSNQ